MAGARAGQAGAVGQGRRWLRALMMLVLGLPLVWFGLPQLTSGCNRRVAQRLVERSAIEAGAPTGLLGARWLMSPNEVRTVRPNVHAHGDDVLAEETEMFGEPVMVSYRFLNGMLLMAQVTFPFPVTPEEYLDMRVNIVAEYGELAEPQETQEYVLHGAIERGGVKVAHILHNRDGELIQQLLIYRTQR